MPGKKQEIITQHPYLRYHIPDTGAFLFINYIIICHKLNSVFLYKLSQPSSANYLSLLLQIISAFLYKLSQPSSTNYLSLPLGILGV
ncbi:MAG: hypothetical protein ACTHKA_25320 [Anaerocolumna jejuensis]